MGRMRHTLSLFALGAALSCSAPALAADITYKGVQQFGGATVDLTLTTDGTTGALFVNNIVSFSVTIDDAGGKSTINNSNGQISYPSYPLLAEYGQFNMTASTTDIFFSYADFPVGGIELLFQAGPAGGGGAFYCLSSNGCWGGTSSYSKVGANSQPSVGGGVSGALAAEAAYPSSDIVAVAVPEPGVWMLLLVGIGLAGGLLRIRRVEAIRRA